MAQRIRPAALALTMAGLAFGPLSSAEHVGFDLDGVMHGAVCYQENDGKKDKRYKGLEHGHPYSKCSNRKNKKSGWLPRPRDIYRGEDNNDEQPPLWPVVQRIAALQKEDHKALFITANGDGAQKYKKDKCRTGHPVGDLLTDRDIKVVQTDGSNKVANLAETGVVEMYDDSSEVLVKLRDSVGKLPNLRRLFRVFPLLAGEHRGDIRLVGRRNSSGRWEWDEKLMRMRSRDYTYGTTFHFSRGDTEEALDVLLEDDTEACNARVPC